MGRLAAIDRGVSVFCAPSLSAVDQNHSMQTFSTWIQWQWKRPKYSGLQNCPNVCMFVKDLIIVSQWMDHFPKFFFSFKTTLSSLLIHFYIMWFESKLIILWIKQYFSSLGQFCNPSILNYLVLGMSSICLDNCCYPSWHAFYKSLTYLWRYFIPLLGHSLP